MNFMLEVDAYSILEKCGASLPKYRFAKTINEAQKAADEIGYPVVMKIVSEDILHKSDIGAVKVGLKNTEDVKAAYNAIMESANKAVPNGRHRGVLVTEMISSGVETIIGLGIDPEFGRYIMFGMGGVFVEVFKDVSFRMIPLSLEDARSMIDEVRGSMLLKGYRGDSKKDVEALTKLLITCSNLFLSYPDIKEMDLNPVIVNEDGAFVLDARIGRESN